MTVGSGKIYGPDQFVYPNGVVCLGWGNGSVSDGSGSGHGEGLGTIRFKTMNGPD